jgi:hypothetical protein
MLFIASSIFRGEKSCMQPSFFFWYDQNYIKTMSNWLKLCVFLIMLDISYESFSKILHLLSIWQDALFIYWEVVSYRWLFVACWNRLVQGTPNTVNWFKFCSYLFWHFISCLF